MIRGVQNGQDLVLQNQIGLARRQKNTVFTEFFVPRMFKKHENTTYLTIFRLYLVGGS